MKNTLKKLIILSTPLLLGNMVAASESCCPPAATNNPHGQHAEMMRNHASGNALEAKAFKALLPAYLATQEALAGDDLDSAKSAAAELASKAGNFSSVAAKHLAMAGQAIADANEIATARRAFLDVSNVMIATARTKGIASDADLYLAHCPMAFNNSGGSWLQDESVLANPYYGSMMLRCGSINPVAE